jgi:hypothetical protein
LEKPGAAPPSAPRETAVSGKEAYEAFKAVDREPKRLHIRPVIQPWVWATYSYLQYIAEDNGRGTRVNLVFGFLVVVVKGRNLGRMISAINSENCEFIEEFDALRHAPPGPDDAVIQSIQYHMDKEKRATVIEDIQDGTGKRAVESA